MDIPPLMEAVALVAPLLMVQAELVVPLLTAPAGPAAHPPMVRVAPANY